MDIRKIRHVSVLAAERNFVRAAARLSITQSALSHSIARLEKEIGLVLFDRSRSSQGAVLTSAGKEFVRRAEDLLITESGLLSDLKLLRENRVGHIAWGLSPLPASLFLRPVMLGMVRTHPTLQVHAELASTEHLLGYLLQEEIEFFIADSSNITPGKKIDIRDLARIHVGFFVRDGHPLALRKHLTVSDIRDYPWISTQVPERSHAKVRRWLNLSGTDSLQWSKTCDDLAAIAHIALNSDAVLLLPHSAISTELANGQFRELPLSDLRHKGYSKICLVSLAKRTLSPAAQMIIEHVETHLAEIDPSLIMQP